MQIDNIEDAIEVLRLVDNDTCEIQYKIDAHKLAIKALERDIKVQPVFRQRERTLFGDYPQIKCWFECPVCGNHLIVGDHYCSECGRALLPFDFERE